MQETQETQAQSVGLEDLLEEGTGNPLECSCLENPMYRGAWQAMVHRVAKSWTWLKCKHSGVLIVFLAFYNKLPQT